MSPTTESFPELRFDNRFTRELPGDPSQEPGCRQVPGACYSRVRPLKAPAPTLLAHSQELAETLGIPEAACLSPRFTEIFSGNEILEGMDPHAMNYGGHQFGHWAGQLGDGRAINLGELLTPSGERQMLQLKGAGPTPYSRGADGLAVLRSSLREFICSEAMFHLGVPTTRALSLITTGASVTRDMFYDGHPRPEPGAVVCRVAPTFLRLGNFQIHAARNEIEILEKLVEYTVTGFFPHLGPPSRDTTLAWFEEVCQRTLSLMVDWTRIGFVHGVMNTDNLSILGLTIDYGPYGWLDAFDPDWTPNTTDASGRRYRFGHQGAIAIWNLVQLGSALVPLIGEPGPLQEILDRKPAEYREGWLAMQLGKLGLSPREPDGDELLVKELQELLAAVETDFTLFYRALGAISLEELGGPLDELGGAAGELELPARLEETFYEPDSVPAEHREKLGRWLRSYRDRSREESLDEDRRREAMNAINPCRIPRNYLAQLAIDRAEKGDAAGVAELLEASRRPYEDRAEFEEYTRKRPDWARHRPGCSMLSCSS